MPREPHREKSIGTDALVFAQSVSPNERRTGRWKGWAVVTLSVAGSLFVLAPIDSAASAQPGVQQHHASVCSAADKKEAQKAAREAKKAERARQKAERDEARAAKKEERAAKAHSKGKHGDDDDTRTASKSKSDSKDANVDLGGNDPLEGL